MNNFKSKEVFIIAEAGVNHNGSLELAKKLIDIASEAGVNAVKFQTFKTNNLVIKNSQKAFYQKKTTSSHETQFEMLKRLEMDIDMHYEIVAYCKKKKITFISSPFDLESIDLLNDLQIEIFKIPSGEITNLPYLEKIGKLNKKIILSTGMSDMNEIKNALNLLINSGTNKNNITVLHANTEYPTPMVDVNLRAMLNIGKTFDVGIGYSDHTLGIEVDIAAVALGASCIEKHFTIDSNLEGPDHKASLNPTQLKEMVIAIRNIELALGDGIKKPSRSEIKNIEIVRKSIVAKVRIRKNEIFTENNLTIKRPGTGINPMQWNKIIGTKATRDYEEDELI